MEEKKPPVGLKQKEIYDKECCLKRIEDIIEAMYRYSKVDTPIPVEWIEELERKIYRFFG